MLIAIGSNTRLHDREANIFGTRYTCYHWKRMNQDTWNSLQWNRTWDLAIEKRTFSKHEILKADELKCLKFLAWGLNTGLCNQEANIFKTRYTKSGWAKIHEIPCGEIEHEILPPRSELLKKTYLLTVEVLRTEHTNNHKSLKRNWNGWLSTVVDRWLWDSKNRINIK